MSDTFEINFKALPPELQRRLWSLALDTNTHRINFAYRSGVFRTSLTYNLLGVHRLLEKTGLLDDVARWLLLLFDHAFIEETLQPRPGLGGGHV